MLVGLERKDFIGRILKIYLIQFHLKLNEKWDLIIVVSIRNLEYFNQKMVILDYFMC